MAWTFLRDNLYLDFLPRLAGEDGVIRGPADGGRVAAVAQDDVAAATTAVLTDPSAHAGSTYSLTGPEAFTLTEATPDGPGPAVAGTAPPPSYGLTSRRGTSDA